MPLNYDDTTITNDDGITLFDNAFTDYYVGVYANTLYSPPDWAFKESAKRNNGQVQLPLISLWRLGYAIDWDMYNAPLHRRGIPVWQDRTPGNITSARGLPMLVSYQLDVWAQTRQILDILVREVLFYTADKPEISVTFQQVEETQSFAFRIEEGPIDNSDITSFESVGYVYRNTFTIIFPNAMLLASKDVPYLPSTGFTIDTEFS
jgi:hypothetical protein